MNEFDGALLAISEACAKLAMNTETVIGVVVALLCIGVVVWACFYDRSER